MLPAIPCFGVVPWTAQALSAIRLNDSQRLKEIFSVDPENRVFHANVDGTPLCAVCCLPFKALGCESLARLQASTGLFGHLGTRASTESCICWYSPRAHRRAFSAVCCLIMAHPPLRGKTLHLISTRPLSCCTRVSRYCLHHAEHDTAVELVAKNCNDKCRQVLAEVIESCEVNREESLDIPGRHAVCLPP